MNVLPALSALPRWFAASSSLPHLLLVSAFLMGAPTSLARAVDAPLFAYVDAYGVLHITDRLGDVPEPYYTVYKQRRAAPSASGEAPTARTSPVRPVTQVAATQTSAPAAEQQASARRQWQELMATWRDQLTRNTQALQGAEAEALGASNPVLRETPVGRQRWHKAQARAAELRGKVMQARGMLLDTLPARAKREHVPPQWLTP